MTAQFFRRYSSARTRAFFRLPDWLTGKGRRLRLRQLFLPFLDRSTRLAQRFKAGIVVGTAAVILLVFAASPSARYAANWLSTHARWTILELLGLPLPRPEIDAQWRRKLEISTLTRPRKAAEHLR